MSAHAASCSLAAFAVSAHHDPLDPAGEERDRRVLLGVDPVGDHLGQPGLRCAPRLQRAAHDDRRLTGPGEQVREHVLADHQLHLVRHARAPRRRPCRRARPGHPARCRSGWGSARAPFGHVGLAQVVRRHVPAAGPEQRRDVLDELLPPLQLDAQELGDRLAGHVVLGGSEPAAHDDRVGIIEHLAHRADHPAQVVADLAVLHRVDADRGELLADPRGVRIDDLAEQELGADREDVSPHSRPPASPGGRCRSPR